MNIQSTRIGWSLETKCFCSCIHVCNYVYVCWIGWNLDVSGGTKYVEITLKMTKLIWVINKGNC